MMMKPLKYFADDRHAMLGEHASSASNRQIGRDGGNLTVSILSFNRSELSIRALKSISTAMPDFAGHILIADNGSQPAEIETLEKFINAECLARTKLVKLGRNHGVAGGRNRAFAEVETDWILSLDNDIYLTGNPIPEIERDLGTIGCHFLNVPLVNPDRATFHSFGGHLEPVIEDGRMFLRFICVLPRDAKLEEARKIVPPDAGFLCSFLFGGASVINRHSFAAMGGFDAAMFVGFEDIEFSLRLFRGGYKIGSSQTTCFVHDHCKATTAADLEYENIRYSSRILKSSAQYFEAKHGLAIWDHRVENWIADKRRHQGLPRE